MNFFIRLAILFLYFSCNLSAQDISIVGFNNDIFKLYTNKSILYDNPRINSEKNIYNNSKSLDNILQNDYKKSYIDLPITYNIQKELSRDLIQIEPFHNILLSLSAGSYKKSINGKIFNDFIVNANVNFKLNSWIRIFLYTQYSLLSKKNALEGGFFLSPQSYYGITCLLNIYNKDTYSFDLAIGVENYFNPLRNKWELRYRLGPQIRIK